ncbi:hypothetical protein DFA_04410 [Cavenderia fasciculata]|uniref:Ankyrin repeat-containing protein n=1 Tax=Cavenderia fasciculata TaxID=261658 RepID=F4PPH9_CACFS|nr:uncharacterized protein DFA_04410 [Cavenderia fasciculata]EGG22292.1 hypothetical protein DFA_04410 [Cavenderia fasciculata]|eukprot:XP_004360143.1 hypothetical protein DFA_04410 [Cavenderia fasciculata]
MSTLTTTTTTTSFHCIFRSIYIRQLIFNHINDISNRLAGRKGKVVEFLHFNRTEGASTKAMDWASEYGHLDIVKFLYKHRSECVSTSAVHWAVANGTEIIKFLEKYRTQPIKER